MKICTANMMNEIDRRAAEIVPSILLMENAARSVAYFCYKKLKGKKILIVCGKGNNGGDGFALARILRNESVKVYAFSKNNEKQCESDLGDIKYIDKNFSHDAAINLKYLNSISINVESEINCFEQSVRQADVVIDALLGTGFKGELNGLYAQVVQTINEHSKYVISLDIPSGLDADNGSVNPIAVKANETITFCMPKIGLFLNNGVSYSGKVRVANIDIPDKIMNDFNACCFGNILTDDEALAMLPKREQRSNKGTYGKVAVFAGSENMPGAAVLVCKAAYKIGAGLVYAIAEETVRRVLHCSLSEVVTKNLHDKYENSFLDGMTCAVVGPGITQDAKSLVEDIVINSTIPLVIDADALNIISKNLDILSRLKCVSVITPHMGEMSRLTGLSIDEILSNPLKVALDFSKSYGVITLLKDARSIIVAPDGRYFINTTGCPAMSKAGAGDVLAGTIAGLIAQKVEPFYAAALGAYIHGKAGENYTNQYGLMASDIINSFDVIPILISSQKNKCMLRLK